MKTQGMYEGVVVFEYQIGLKLEFVLFRIEIS